MSHQVLGVLFDCLGGTITKIDGAGYKVLHHPQADRIYQSLSSAKWFLAQQWCNHHETPAGILTHTGHFAFQNECAHHIGAETFIPSVHRTTLFNLGLRLEPGGVATHAIPAGDQGLYRTVEIARIEIDPTYGKILPVRSLPQDLQEVPIKQTESMA